MDGPRARCSARRSAPPRSRNAARRRRRRRGASARPCTTASRRRAAARMAAHLGVEGRALVADLAHVAQHQPARAGQRSQHVDGGAHRVGVGVVGVVDQRDAAPPPAALQPRAAPPAGSPPAALHRGQRAAGQRKRRPPRRARCAWLCARRPCSHRSSPGACGRVRICTAQWSPPVGAARTSASPSVAKRIRRRAPASFAPQRRVRGIVVRRTTATPSPAARR